MADREVVQLLFEGVAFAELGSWRKIKVSGADAREWLNNLVSADIADVGAGRARRSLLLSPTGQIRAEFTVSFWDGALLVLQDPAQPRSIGDLLARYVLSSAVTLEDRTNELTLFAFPGRNDAPDVPGVAVSRPSCLGAGVDLIAPRQRHAELAQMLAGYFRLATPDDVEAWRIAAGIPRAAVDAFDDDLPQEAGLESAVSFGKGCYLGQEAVAKVRNLGHPRRVLVLVSPRGRVRPNSPVFAGGNEAGVVTSSSDGPDGPTAFIKVRWAYREGPFTTADGVALSPIERSGMPT